MFSYLSIESYTQMQTFAKETITELLDFIRPGVSERQIAARAKEILESKGIHEFWYYGVAALVLVGERTPLSLSGRDYKPAETIVGQNDLVTIDLSPLRHGYWGDYARSIFVEDGHTKLKPEQPALVDGFNMEAQLHTHFLDTAKPDMSAHDIWEIMNALIELHGFENLDFKGNLGHSIEKDIKLRRYIEKGNHTPLGDLGLFTFEPHIRKKGQPYGFKHENIHFFKGSQLCPL